jgi:hypothetical protein
MERAQRYELVKEEQKLGKRKTFLWSCVINRCDKHIIFSDGLDVLLVVSCLLWVVISLWTPWISLTNGRDLIYTYDDDQGTRWMDMDE